MHGMISGNTLGRRFYGAAGRAKEAAMISKKLREFLDSQHIKYVTITHSPAYTAQGIAAAAHVSGKDLAKTVIVKVDGTMAMAVLPASKKIDLDQLKKAIGGKNVELATEAEFASRFPDCELGAMPPFGNQYGMEVYVSEELAQDEEIAFNAGSHSELIKMAYADYERLEGPKVIRMAAPQAA